MRGGPVSEKSVQKTTYDLKQMLAELEEDRSFFKPSGSGKVKQDDIRNMLLLKKKKGARRDTENKVSGQPDC